VLDELETKRASVAAAAGDPQALETAFAALEETFTRLTGAASTRKEGQAYAGRTVVYEECRRAIDVDFGEAMIAKLGPPLSLVLESARWYTHELAAKYRSAFSALHARLTAVTGSAVLDYARFWQHVPALFPGPKAENSIVREVAETLRARWWAILAPSAGERHVQRTVESLRARVHEAFAAPGPGWPAARHHSPDIMIAARSVEDLARGQALFVLGELHTGMNTVANPFVVKEHRDPEALIAARERDLPVPGIAPVWSKAKTRADYFSLSRHDFDLENGATRSARPRRQVLATADLVVEDAGGSLIVRTRDGARCFDLIAFLEHHLIAESFGEFRIRSNEPHSPRVTIGDLVVCREQWRFEPGQLEFARRETTWERMAAAHTWRRTYALPRRVFAKTPEEVKPFYVDLESPVLLDLFAKAVRQASSVQLAEMLPDLDQSWLADAEQRRYTSELRLAAVDLTISD
jgi:hypothetical protein